LSCVPTIIFFPNIGDSGNHWLNPLKLQAKINRSSLSVVFLRYFCHSNIQVTSTHTCRWSKEAKNAFLLSLDLPSMVLPQALPSNICTAHSFLSLSYGYVRPSQPPSIK
jgi:hypothetical protein